jgi:hypothetical protein
MPFSFIPRGERWARTAPSAFTGMPEVPGSRSLPGGPQSGFKTWCGSVSSTGHTVHRSGPLNLISQYSKLQQFCKIQNAPFWCSKFFETLHEFRLTHYGQLSFWIWTKFVGGRKLILNLDFIYWRFKHVWKI